VSGNEARRRPPEPTHYERLGLTPDADIEQLRLAYHRQARALDLDSVQGAGPAAIGAADRALNALNEAWRVLRDPDTRAAYDATLAAQAAQAEGPGGPDAAADLPRG